MTARAAFCVVARDKASYVAQTVRAVLAQETKEPIDIYLSDQGSQDGTRAIMQREAQRYNGPHRVRLIDCPDTGPRGMPGLNAHYNWLHNAIPADFVLYTAADDIPTQNRMQRTLDILEEFSPDYIGTMQANVSPAGEYTGHTARPTESGWCSLRDIVEHNLGGSMSSAWSKKCFERHGPLFSAACQDLIVPVWAALEGGMYYLAEAVQVRLHRLDRNNTGLEGLKDTRQTETGRQQVDELMHYQFVANWSHMVLRIDAHYGAAGMQNAEVVQTMNFLMGRIIGQSRAWADTRDALTAAQTQPACFATRKGLAP